MRDVTVIPMGIATEPSPYSAAPDGALRICQEAVIRRAGIVEPMPGRRTVTTVTAGGWTGPIIHIAPFGLTAYLVIEEDGVAAWSSAPSTDAGHASGFLLGWTRSIQARKNLYVNYQRGVLKWTGTTDTTPDDCGIQRPEIVAINVTGASGWLADGNLVAYRAVIEREDDNGVVIYSSPSGRGVVKNDSGGTRDIAMTVAINPSGSVVAGDLLRIYATIQATTDPPIDDMLLKVTHVITSSDITAGLVSALADAVDDSLPENMGKALYTNSDREGRGFGNIQPYQCKDVATFRESTFLGQLQGPQRVILRAEMSASSLTTQADGIGFRSMTGNRTLDSAVIDGIADTTGLLPGMVLFDATDWNSGGAPVRIVTVDSGTQVTMNVTATSSATGATFVFVDSIRIGSYYYGIASVRAFIDVLSSGDTASDTPASDTFFAYGLGTTLRADGSTAIESVKREFVIEELFAGGTTDYEVWATHGDEYDPALPEPTEGTGYAMDRDDWPNGIMWSKRDQPEHFTLADTAFVGSERHKYLRAISSRDALWIFKEDGLFRLSGSGYPNFRIDPYDPSLKLVHQNAACNMHGTVYAWCNRGVVAIDDGSPVRSVSAGRIDDQLRTAMAYLTQNELDTAYCWMVPNEKDNEVWLGVPGIATSTGIEYGARIYVYNAKTDTWTRSIRHIFGTAAVRGVGDLLFGETSDVRHERMEYDSDDKHERYADEEYAVTITDITNTQITISAGSGWTPAVGDAVQQGGDHAIVVTVDSATVFDVDTQVDLDTGAATAYEGYAALIEPIAVTGKDAAMLKLFQEVTWVMYSQAGVARLTLDWASTLDASLPEADADTTTSQAQTRSVVRSDPTAPREYRAIVPYQHARCTNLFPRIIIRQALAPWRLEQCHVFYEPQTQKVMEVA